MLDLSGTSQGAVGVGLLMASDENAGFAGARKENS
jgi:hypothetical protein